MQECGKGIICVGKKNKSSKVADSSPMTELVVTLLIFLYLNLKQVMN